MGVRHQKLPAVTEGDISDRNKGDIVVKMVAMGQILWVIIQLSERLYSKPPTSQLEVLSFAFAICTIFTYVLLLEKPKDVETSVIIPARRYASPWEIDQIAESRPLTFMVSKNSPWIPNLSFHDMRRTSSGKLGGSLAGVVFGAIHCVAWNFTFPIEIERILWHGSAIVTAIAYPIFVGILWCSKRFPESESSMDKLDGHFVFLFNRHDYDYIATFHLR